MSASRNWILSSNNVVKISKRYPVRIWVVYSLDMLQRRCHTYRLREEGDIRFCPDFRQLNDYTVRDAYPLSRIADLLDATQYFNASDMRSGYWQIRMRNEDIPKTAFLSHQGLCDFTVMPLGLMEEKPLQLLDTVLERLEAAGLKLRLKKCEFAPPATTYLGHEAAHGEA
eukprot:Blabericola_migrator_1__12301@NODE_769_length_6592_cov_104_272490_g547_i0_p2_GENE_NODE_769_length_6592_cov_104_272490_g547_i0NODE_769_length_6592_cov_104_272490_g547_i0_p2_ORF_typecomplete_len170_score4_93RVT_1/PF00078_27/61RVT_1/PF00078_27/0_84_NODE_769_length_6592_cov_104_272490_g547_i0314823